MKKLILSLGLTLLTVTTAMAQSIFSSDNVSGAMYRGVRSYNIGLSVPGGFAFDKTPIDGVSVSQSVGVSLGYTTVFAELGNLSLSSESEVVYRSVKELYRDNTETSRANVQGLTGLGLYLNSGEHLAFYAKGLIGINTGLSSAYGSSFSHLLTYELRAGVLYSLGSHFSVFGETGYGQDILRVGISIR